MLEQLRTELEEAAFLVVKEAGQKKIHSKIVNCLVILSRIESGDSNKALPPKDAEVAEINKVSRKLKRWANHQDQYNSKILNAYLELRRSGEKEITEDALNAELGPNTWFTSNFSQMKSIADKNHGKVFHQVGELIEIWTPVVSAVREYEKKVFGEL